MRDGMLYHDRLRYFEELRPKLETAGHRLVYAEELKDGTFKVMSSPAGWLDPPCPSCKGAISLSAAS